MDAAETLRWARADAGLTQMQLAARMGSTQASVARLERRGSNPTVATLSRALEAAGRTLVLGSKPISADVDIEQIRAQLRLTPTERVRRHAVAYRSTAALMRQLER